MAVHLAGLVQLLHHVRGRDPLDMASASEAERVTVLQASREYGHQTLRYSEAIAPGAMITKRLGLHVIPISVRKTDVARSLPPVMSAMDCLARLHGQGEKSLADYPIRSGGQFQRLRDVDLTEGD